MTVRRVGLAILALALVGALGFDAWIWRLPLPAQVPPPSPVADEETAAMLAALKPVKRKRPLVAVIGINDATETTDYLMPTGILRRADVADVFMLSTRPGPVKLYPALTVEADSTLDQFNETHADGADYVIVPAMSRDDDPQIIAFLREQAAKGAFIVSVCAGAKVVAAAGLLDGRRATTHWYYLDDLLERSPTVTYVPDRRMVVDGRVVTTTGITASMPMMLTLIEAIGGRQKAEEVAAGLGVASWDARHASEAFRLTRPFAMTVMANALRRDHAFGIEIDDGVDEVALALTADAWSRTYRSQAATIAEEPVRSRNGIRVIPDSDGSDIAALPAFIKPERKPSDALDGALRSIASRYGAATARVVAMQLEYPADELIDQ